MTIPTDPKINNLLEQIGCLWPPAYTDLQLKTISKIWNKKLFLYGDDILMQALDDLADNFHRKPTLADFLCVCKQHQARKAPIAMTVIKDNFIAHSQYRARIARQYGEEAGKKVDKAYREYDEAKKNGTMDGYIRNVLRGKKKIIEKICND